MGKLTVQIRIDRFPPNLKSTSIRDLPTNRPDPIQPGSPKQSQFIIIPMRYCFAYLEKSLQQKKPREEGKRRRQRSSGMAVAGFGGGGGVASVSLLPLSLSLSLSPPLLGFVELALEMTTTRTRRRRRKKNGGNKSIIITERVLMGRHEEGGLDRGWAEFSHTVWASGGPVPQTIGLIFSLRNKFTGGPWT